MSARGLALRLAMRRADKTLAQLPRFAEGENPLRVRACLLAYYELYDASIAERAALAAAHAPLRERVAMANVLADIEVAIASARSWLTRVAKRGGRGVLASQEGM